MSKDTEILTNNGWKKIDNISYKDKCFSFNVDKKEIEIVDIDNIIKEKRNEELINIKNKHIDLLITDDHNLLIKKNNNKYKNKHLKDFSKSKYHNELKKEFYLEQAKNIYNKRINIPISGVVDNNNICNLDYLKLLLIIICDGCINKDVKCNSYDIFFTLKKQRKIDYLEKLLNNLNIDYSKTYCKCREKKGQYNVYRINILGGKKIKEPIVNMITLNKIIPSFFINLSTFYKQELLKTYCFFDGYFDKNNKDNLHITSINKKNIDILQIMAITSNSRAIISKYNNSKGTFNTVNDIYKLHITLNKQYERITENINYSKIKYNDFVWCISNINKTIIVRRNGKVAIVGNCGLAIDFAVYINGELDFNSNEDYCLIAGLFLAKAKELNIRIRSGAIWNGSSIRDNTFKDLGHIEIL